MTDHEKRAAEWLCSHFVESCKGDARPIVATLVALLDTIAAEADAAGYARGVRESLAVVDSHLDKIRTLYADGVAMTTVQGELGRIVARLTAMRSGDHVSGCGEKGGAG